MWLGVTLVASVRAVLFDLDETLISDLYCTRAAMWVTLADAAAERNFDLIAAAAAVMETARELWPRTSEAPYCRRIGIGAWEGLWATFATGEHPSLVALRGLAPSYRREVWRAGLQRVGIDDLDLVASLAERYVGERAARQQRFPEVDGVLAELQAHYRLALVTNGDPDLQRRKVVGADLVGRFPVIAISGVLDIGKPDPRIFLYALRALGLGPEDAVMVGDNPTSDIAGARAAGMRSVHIDRGYTPRSSGDEEANAVLPDLNGLPELLQSWNH